MPLMVTVGRDIAVDVHDLIPADPDAVAADELLVDELAAHAEDFDGDAEVALRALVLRLRS